MTNSRAHCRCGQFEDTDHACPVTHARLKAEIEGAHHDIDRLMAACTAEANEVERLRAHLRDIGSLATPEDSADDERQFARMREMVMAALGGSSEPGVVYRKWPSEPPHCMSCNCGMTDEQKRTVPLDDYLRIHRQLIDLKYPGTAWDPNRCVVCGGNHGNLPCPQMTVTCG